MIADARNGFRREGARSIEFERRFAAIAECLSDKYHHQLA